MTTRFRTCSAHLLLIGIPVLTVAGCQRERGSISTDSLPLASVEPEVRIGSVDDPDYAFGAVTALEVGADGRIYTLHRQESVIRRWTPAGGPDGTIGRRGEGPGEFVSPDALGWRADSLWVFDSARNSRITFFDADGKYLGDITPLVDIGTPEQTRQGTIPPRPAGLLGDGTLHGVTPGFSQSIVAGTLTRLAHVRMNREGATLDTILTVPIGRESVLGVLRDGGGTFSSQPFGDAVLNAVTKDGRALLVVERPAAAQAGPAEFRLHRVELSGDTVLSRSFAYAPVPISRDTVEKAIESTAGGLHRFVGERTGTTLPQWRGWIQEAMYTPAHYPPVTDLRPGRDGTVWIALNQSGGEGDEWLVLDERGEPLGKVMIPAGMRILLADRRTVWGVERDDLDVQYIVRYRVAFP